MAEGSAAGARRSTAIVLFTDLVGSTELRSRLGEEAAEEVRREHDRLVTVAIEANRGRLVKNLGDGVMATFSGASDAVAAAVDIQQALDRFSRSDRSGASLGVRVGLSAGDVAFEGGDCFGTPVVEAARLCAAANAGQILTSELVRGLAGTGSGHPFRSVGALDLKGLLAPVAACEVAWQPLPAAPLPLPSLLTTVGRIFVGRGNETERLAQLWKEAAAGERRVGLLAGEPGIGKTRLAAELAHALHEEGAIVLAGRCDEDLGVPYQPFVEALRHYVVHAPERRLGRHGGELTRLLPELTEVVPGLPPPLRSDPETERYRLFDAVAAWLAEASLDAPVLLVLDDLHWAAKPTLLLLRHVLRSTEPLCLLVVATYRDSEVGRGHPFMELLADLRRLEGVERFPLTGLDQAGVAAFIEAAAGHALAEKEEALPRAVWAETEGNPFFVAEVLRHLAETGAVAQEDGRWVITTDVEELGIPEGVRDVVGRRLSRLSGAANTALGVASVAGLEFEPGVVGSAGDLEEDALLATLEEGVAARLLSEVPGSVPRYRFGHALVRATLYDELTAARRVTLHRRIAEAIETLHAGALDDHLPALVHHWARASAPTAETTRAVDYAARAGDRALAQLAHHEAAAYYRQALDLLDVAEGMPDAGKRLELLISLGEAQRRAGDPAHREVLLEAARLARQRGDAERLARAALANCRGSFSGVGIADQERVAAIEAALGAIGDRHDAMKARLLANLAMELVWVSDLDRRATLSAEAVDVARRVGDPDVLGSVLASRFLAIWDPSTVEERLAVTAEGVAIAASTQDPTSIVHTNYRRAIIMIEIGDLQKAEGHLLATERLAGEGLLHPFLRSLCMHTRATLLLAGGRLEEAEAASREALAIAQEAGQADAAVFFAIQLVGIRFEQGRVDDEMAAQLAATAERLPAVGAFQAMLALAYCELDRPGEARDAFNVLAERGLQSIHRDNMWGPTMAIASSVCARLEDADQAGLLYELLSPYDRLILSHTLAWYGAVPHYLGVLAKTTGRYDESERHFSDAAAIHERIAAPGSLARTRLESARMLLARRQPGDAERARELLGQAVAAARELGLGSVERQAVGLLK